MQGIVSTLLCVLVHAFGQSEIRSCNEHNLESRCLESRTSAIAESYFAVQSSKKCCWEYTWQKSASCVQVALNASVTIQSRPPPFLVVHGHNDRTVLPNQARWLVGALKKNGGKVDQVWHNSGHGGVELQHAKAFLDQFCSAMPPLNNQSTLNASNHRKPACVESYNVNLEPRRIDRATFQGHPIPMFHFYDAPHRALEPPLLVWIHGGGWLGGSPDEMHNDHHWQMRMVRFGWAVASLGYRHSNEAKWPAQVLDVSAALAHLCKDTSKYRFDRNRVVAVGFSSGGHLASMLGTRSFQGKRLVHGVVSFSGPTQLLTMDYDTHLHVKSELAHFAQNGVESKLIGCTLSDFISKFVYLPKEHHLDHA